jgi:uncharacterized phage protein gp47/JayE
MILNLQNFATLVQNSAAAVQGACAQLVNFSVGTAMRALIEANATVALWVQWLVLQVLSMTRLATSTGTDADSFVNDFGMTRLPGISATGLVTLSRYSTAVAAIVPTGAAVVTTDGTQTFLVTGGPYTIPIGTASASVAVQAVNTGTQGNVQAGAIGLLASSIPGVDTVTNPLAFVNGLNAESDAALRARFVLFINSRSLATVLAIQYAALSVQQGLSVVVSENTAIGGGYQPGNFLVTVDDGTGYPNATTIANVSAAVNAVRPIGSTYSVFGPAVYGASISTILTLAAGASRTTIDGEVNTAVTAYVQGLPVSATLPFGKLQAVIFGADPAITNAATTLNGGTADVVPGTVGVVRLTSLSVA